MRWPSKLVIVSMLSLMMSLLSGCWSDRPVEYRALALAMGFSPAPQAKIRVTLQFPTRSGLTTLTGAGASSGSSGSTSPPSYSVSATGMTPGSALARIQGQVQSEVYLGQIQILAFSPRLSQSQMGTIDDFLTRMGPMDKTAYVVGTPSVKALFSVNPSNGALPVMDLVQGFSCNNCETVTYRQHQWDLEVALPTPGDSAWMPYVTIGPKGFVTDQIMVYRGLIPAEILPPRQSMLLGYTLGRTGRGYVSYMAGGDRIGVRTMTASPSEKATLDNGKLTLCMNLNITGTLDTWTGPALTPALVQWIQSHTNQFLSQQILSALVSVQQHGSDPTDFLGPLIWRKEPQWRYLPVWEKVYRTADVVVHVNFHLRNVGDSN